MRLRTDGQYRYIQSFQDEVVDDLSIKKGSKSLLPAYRYYRIFFLMEQVCIKVINVSLFASSN